MNHLPFQACAFVLVFPNTDPRITLDIHSLLDQAQSSLSPLRALSSMVSSISYSMSLTMAATSSLLSARCQSSQQALTQPPGMS